MKTKLTLPVFALLLVFAACEPRELPAPVHTPGGTVVSAVDMGAAYEYQLFYSLDVNKVISKNLKTAWDLGFECSRDGFHVILNSSKLMYAWNTGQDRLEEVNDTAGFAANRLADASSGNMDSTAIGDWRIERPVFIIDRGISAAGDIGLMKLQITESNDAGYSVSFQSFEGAAVRSLYIPRDTLFNFRFISFDDGGKLVDIEPPKAKWDLCFTQYTVRIPTYYLVTGVLLNSWQTKAVMDSTMPFEKIDLAYALEQLLSPGADAIGYDWKTYDFDAATYQVNPNRSYIIKTQNEVYYKLHFLDFYNAQGQKGNPQWACIRL